MLSEAKVGSLRQVLFPPSCLEERELGDHTELLQELSAVDEMAPVCMCLTQKGCEVRRWQCPLAVRQRLFHTDRRSTLDVRGLVTTLGFL